MTYTRLSSTLVLKFYFSRSLSFYSYLSLSNGVNILTGDDPIVVKFGPKCTDPQSRKDARFTFHTRRAVQSTIADLLVTIFTTVTISAFVDP